MGLVIMEGKVGQWYWKIRLLQVGCRGWRKRAKKGRSVWASPDAVRGGVSHQTRKT